MLWASTSTKDPTFPDTCLGCLAAPGTIDTVPERTLLAFAEHGNPDERLKPDQALAEATIAQIPAAVIDVDGLAEQLQRQVAGAFTADWAALLEAMTAKVDQLRRT